VSVHASRVYWARAYWIIGIELHSEVLQSWKQLLFYCPAIKQNSNLLYQLAIPYNMLEKQVGCLAPNLEDPYSTLTLTL
jgi:hypothetical protein